MPEQVEAATVDHGLRQESAEEATTVAALCAQRGVPHATLKVEVPPGNLQANAREARYSALARWAGERRLDAIATAHHADDQAETLLMRLNRGSGLAGLAGVRPVASLHGAKVIRPLLDWRRSDLAALLDAAGIESMADPSNEDPRFDRVRVRAGLAAASWLDAAGLAKSVALLAEAQEAIEWMVSRELSHCVETGGSKIAYSPFEAGAAGKSPVWFGVIREIASQLGCVLTAAEAARLAEGLQRGEKVNIGGMQGTPLQRPNGLPLWVFTRENPRAAR